jgi:nucleoside-diphosphate kinase
MGLNSSCQFIPAAQQTLVLIKPDALERKLVGCLIQRFELAGLKIRNCRWTIASRTLLTTHYAELKEKNPRAFARTLEGFADKPFIALALEGPNVILKARALIGPTDPSKAPPGTIRGDFGSDGLELADQENRATQNLVHASDSPESAQRELALWFPSQES